MKKIAAIVYVPNNDWYLRQFYSLYYSVMSHPELRQNIDFIIGCPPEAAFLMPSENCHITHLSNISELLQYRFKKRKNTHHPHINSWSHFLDEASVDFIRRYPLTLRIDVDCFISPSILDLDVELGELFTGKGRYTTMQTRKNLRATAEKLDLRHRKIHDIGSTWFGRTDDVMYAAKSSLIVSEHFFEHEFEDAEGWPTWHWGVTTMYAGEIALNHSDLDVKINKRFDWPSFAKRDLKDAYSIHCLHGNKYFSKAEHHNGAYRGKILPADPTDCRDFACHCSLHGDQLFQACSG